MSQQDIRIEQIDYTDSGQTEDFLWLMDLYASDSMGLEEPMSHEARQRFCTELQQLPDAATFLAYKKDRPVGLATCLISFSTFDARKVINVHDVFVLREVRGTGIGDQLLQAIQKRAKQLKCCRLSIEVRDDNHSARKLYERFGFEEGDPPVQFLTKEFY